jgi:hypothetical protein
LKPIAVLSTRPVGPPPHFPGSEERMAASSMAQRAASGIVVGVDTHKDLHVARAKDELGRGLGEITIPASAKGYRALLSWSRGLGEVRAFGVEGSGCYGAGLARHLRTHGEVVIEVIRPNRQARRRRGKSDPADAEAAASAVLSGEASGTPKASDAAVEMIRALRVARSTANRARTQAINALHALVVTAPEELRGDVRGLPGPRLVRTCAGLRPGVPIDPVGATKIALRSLARRHQALSARGAGPRQGAPPAHGGGLPGARRHLRRRLGHRGCAAARGRGQPRASALGSRARQVDRSLFRSTHPPARPRDTG